MLSKILAQDRSEEINDGGEQVKMGALISKPEQDRALAYLSSLGTQCATCRHVAADTLRCRLDGYTQSPHWLCLFHQGVKVERKAMT